MIAAALLVGCSPEAARLDDDCMFNCRYPDSFYRSVETESPRERQNREAANRHRKDVLEEQVKKGPSVGYHSSGRVEIKSHIPTENSVPDYQPSPKEQTWPTLKVRIPADRQVIIEKEESR